MQARSGLHQLLYQALRAGARELAPFENASAAFAAGSREAAHLCASTSASSRIATYHSQAGLSPLTFALDGSSAGSQHPGWSSQQLRGLKVLKRKFKMPEEIAQIVQSKLEAAAAVKAPPPTLPALEPRSMKKHSRRTGAIAFKAGMTQEWDQNGVRVPLTVLWIDDCQVVGLKWPEKHGYSALQIGAGWRRQTDLHPGVAGFFLSQGVPFKEKVVEFKVSRDAMLPVGTQITAAHFVAGQHVDVTGWTKWKGFQGVMKKWNFKGLPASHGVSLSHRAPGSIGNRADPGKVWKGKKMPGNMGDERRTVHDCLIYKVDPARNLVYVRGQVPGPAGRQVVLRDAFNTQAVKRMAWKLPFPTYCGTGAATLADIGRGRSIPAVLEPLLSRHHKGVQPPALPEGIAGLLPPVQVHQDTGSLDPYLPYSKETDYFEVQWKKGE